MHICGHFLHSAKRYQSGCPALRWQIPSLPPPPPPQPPSREGFPTACSNRVRAPIVLYKSSLRLASSERLYRLINPAVASAPQLTVPGRVNLSLDKRGCTNCCWWRQDWVLVDAVADLGQGLEIDRNSFTNSSSAARNLGYRIIIGCGTLTWEKRILILLESEATWTLEAIAETRKELLSRILRNLVYNCVH